MGTAQEHSAAVRDKARQLGFDRVGIADAGEPMDEDFARYEAFINSGRHGSMAYLAAHRSARRTIASEAIVKGARSVICVAQRYARIPQPQDREGLVPAIARYARGRDYHGHLRRRLEKLADFVRTLQSGVAARPLCDTAPVLERAWAARAGLGFIGKNSMLIAPGIGSFLLLGEVVTTVQLATDRALQPRCGRCERCLQACPTRAFVEPYLLDARRCISYLTIEHRGPYDASLGAQVGGRLFGCDACQQVCPYNATSRAFIEVGSAYDPLEQWCTTTLEDLANAPESTIAQLTAGSALKRARPEDLKRNAQLAMAHPNNPSRVVAPGPSQSRGHGR